MALGIAREQPPSSIKRVVRADGGEHIEYFALGRSRVLHAIGSDDRQLEAARDRKRGMVACFFVAIEMPLQLDIDIFASKDAHELLDRAPAFFDPTARERCRERAFVASGQADEPAAKVGKLFGGSGRNRLWV